MNIQIDTREKQKAIVKIIEHFDKNGINHFSSKLYVGDYMNLDNPRVIIDRKQNLLELCTNFSDVPKKEKDGKFKRDKDGRLMTDRARFTAELIKAKQAGLHIIILCEHGGKVKSLEDVKNWQNPRCKESPMAMSGERLYKLMKTFEMSDLYSVSFEFCDKRTTGKRIVELLQV